MLLTFGRTRSSGNTYRHAHRPIGECLGVGRKLTGVRMSLIDVAAYPRAITVANVSPLRDFANFVAVSSHSRRRWQAEQVTVRIEATAEELIGLFPPGTRTDSDGTLMVGGCRLDDVVDQFGTPAIVVSEGALRQRARDYLAAFRSRWPRSDVAFASKSFPCTAVQRVMVEEGLSGIRRGQRVRRIRRDGSDARDVQEAQSADGGEEGCLISAPR